MARLVTPVTAGQLSEQVAMASVLYQCPTTGMNVQAWFEDNTPADDSLTYVSLRCPACARIYLVNRDGKTLVMMTEADPARTSRELTARFLQPRNSAPLRTRYVLTQRSSP